MRDDRAATEAWNEYLRAIAEHGHGSPLAQMAHARFCKAFGE